MPKLGLSINPLGFVQFGPLINVEVGLTDNMVLNLHTRISFLGAAIGKYKWEYGDVSYGEYDYTDRDGLDVTPFGMFEVAFDIAF